MDPLINPKFLYRPLFGQYTPPQTQYGKGFFSIFSKLLPFVKGVFQKIMPVAKKVASHPTVRQAASQLKDHAIDAGLNVANDALKGENIGESLKREAANVGINTAQDLLDTAKASRKRGANAGSEAKKKKKRKKDKLKKGARKQSMKKGLLGRARGDIFDQ